MFLTVVYCTWWPDFWPAVYCTWWPIICPAVYSTSLITFDQQCIVDFCTAVYCAHQCTLPVKLLLTRSVLLTFSQQCTVPGEPGASSWEDSPFSLRRCFSSSQRAVSPGLLPTLSVWQQCIMIYKSGNIVHYDSEKHYDLDELVAYLLVGWFAAFFNRNFPIPYLPEVDINWSIMIFHGLQKCTSWYRTSISLSHIHRSVGV